MCDRNIDCVTTKGGSKWCTGPKTQKCYSYDIADGTWVHLIDLIKARVYAGSVTMPGGSLWIMGGVGIKDVLRSSEILQFINNRWTVKKGPKLPELMMGHCLTALDPWNIIVAGGFSPVTSDFIDKAYILNTKNKQWTTKPWTKLKYGPVMDSTCTSLHWSGKYQVIISGGWNNSVLHSTELFDSKSWKWKKVTGPLNYWKSNMALPYGIRSAVMGELDKKPFLAGGIKCVRYVKVFLLKILWHIPKKPRRTNLSLV